MRTAIATLKSISPYSQSRHYDTPKEKKELANDYEKRTWRDRLHINKEGYVFIPPMAFKNALSEVAKYLGIQVAGKGKNTYTKHFEAGVLVLEGLTLPVKKDDVPGEWYFVPADGRRGGGKRVLKCFPVIQEWQGDVVFYVGDDTITPEIFEQHLKESGQFIGIGRFRPRNNGFYGRYSVEEIVWS